MITEQDEDDFGLNDILGPDFWEEQRKHEQEMKQIRADHRIDMKRFPYEFGLMAFFIAFGIMANDSMKYIDPAWWFDRPWYCLMCVAIVPFGIAFAFMFPKYIFPYKKIDDAQEEKKN